MFDSALDLLVVPLQFLLRFWSFDIFRMFWMVLFWIFIARKMACRGRLEC